VKGGGVVLLVVLVLVAAWLLTHVPVVDQTAAVVHPRTCPAGTFLAADGFCTHVYRHARR